jgi:predicted Zn finger-like uncharacterized protein
MDVQCERCKTEYEFDDALVSTRGTTVRCTHCGHEFKVRRVEAADPAGDRWVVQTAIGQRLTFLTLRELQRAILAKQVARHDILLLGGGSPRALGSITELEPFFEGRSSSRPPPTVADRAPSSGAVEAVVAARRLPSFGTPAAAPVAALAPLLEPPSDHTLSPRSPPPPPPPPPPYAARLEEMTSPLPPPTVPVRRAMPSTDDEVDDMQGAFPPAAEGAFDFPRRRRVGGWIVALVLLLAVGVVGWVAAKPYLFARNAAVTSSPIDGRAQAFLADGEKALSDGDLEAAQQNFDKASALAENDTRVLVGEARVASARADVPWLKLRLLAPDAIDETRATKAQLDERLARVRKAAEDAIAAAPDDHGAVRAEIDALRLAGRQDAARKYVSKIGGLASQPETAYVLAALDLAEPEPFWTTVVDRLRSASAGESNAGRARAALVYALAKSGDIAGARAELAKLDAFARPYPCLPNLHALVDRTPAGGPPDRAAAANIPRIDVSALPQARPAPPAGANPAAGDEMPGDQSGTMHAASQAIKKGDWSRARRIYEALVSRNPSDSEALAGIGDVERAQGDNAGAIDSYKRALAVNPSYLPALLGVADTQWASGDHANARRAYKDIVDRFPDGSYPSYVKPRADPAATSTAAPPAASATKAWDPGDGI